MQCREFEERMHSLLDERQAPERDEQLQAHACQCASCHQILLVQETLFRGIGRVPSPSLPGGFASRVLSRAAGPGATRRPAAARRPWFLAVGVAATAATALIALTIAMNRQPDKPADAPAVAAPGGHAAEKSPDASLALDSSSVKSRPQPVAELAVSGNQPLTSSDAALAAADVESFEQYGQALQTLASRVPKAVERLDEVEEATPGLRPVRTSFTLAIGTIWRTIPPPRKQEPPRPAKRDSGLLWAPAALPV